MFRVSNFERPIWEVFFVSNCVLPSSVFFNSFWMAPKAKCKFNLTCERKKRFLGSAHVKRFLGSVQAETLSDCKKQSCSNCARFGLLWSRLSHPLRQHQTQPGDNRPHSPKTDQTFFFFLSRNWVWKEGTSLVVCLLFEWRGRTWQQDGCTGLDPRTFDFLTFCTTCTIC